MSRLELPTVAAWIFGGFGALMVVGGILLAFEEPAGLALSGFGLVFIGAGYLAFKLFRTPPGKRAVTVSSTSAPTARGSYQSSVIIHVDENASEADIEAAREQWLRDAWKSHVGWVDGCIVEHGASSGSLLRAAAIAWSVFAAGAVGAAFLWGDIAVLVAVPAAGVALTLLWQYLQQRRRQRRFGTSRFHMQPCPVQPGGHLAGIVETGVAHDLAPAGGFEIVMRCVHRYETTERVGSDSRRTVYRRNTLWETTTRAAGRTATRGALVLDVPVDLAVPDDQPPSSLESSSQGIVWELVVSAALPGVDFAAEFHLPVLAADTAALLADASGQSRSTV